MGKPSVADDDQAVRVISGSFTATGTSASFLASHDHAFNVSGSGTFVATVSIERSFDGGTTFVGVSRDGLGTAASFTAPFGVQITEPEPGVLYRLNCTAYSSGPLVYRISQ